jgi:hypothetical protein
VLIILFATQQTLVGKFVGNKTFVGIGLVSYSAYLWHQPLFVFARHRSLSEPSNIVSAVLTVIALLLAYLSWRYVETPFRSRANFSRFRILFYSMISSFFIFSIGMAGHLYNDKIESYWIENNFPEQKRNFYEKLISKKNSNYSENIDGVQDLSECRFNANNLTTETESRIISCYKKYGSGVLILGDSHAIDLFGVLASRFDDNFLFGLTSAGCRPHTPGPQCQYSVIRLFVENNKNVFKGNAEE